MRVTFAGLLLAVGIGFLAAGSGLAADDEDKAFLKEAKEAQAMVVQLMTTMEKGGDTKKQLEEMTKKYDQLKPLMYVFKPRAKGGLGVGPEGKADGIELKISALGKPRGGLSPAQIRAQAADLLKIAAVSKAMADVADHYPSYGKKDVAAWKDLNNDMRKGADELIAAVKSGDPAKLKTAANNLNASCSSCHSKFRDDNN
jgi:cytochrome c556